MNGQWLGKYDGTNAGDIMVNFDDRGDRFEGIVYLNDQNNALPSFAAIIRTQDKGNAFQLSLNRQTFFAINKATGFPIPWDEVFKIYPNVQVPTQVNVAGQQANRQLRLSWHTDVGTGGSAHLTRRAFDEGSRLVAPVKDWSQLKRYISKLEPRRFIYRGQRKPQKLVTAFHRTGRADLLRFLNEDVQTLHRTLSARTRHIFQLKDGDQNGAFLNLIQHHGYPTPLLDWTYSPFVAVFFAFRGITSAVAKASNSGDKVRLFIFDQAAWRADFPQMSLLNLPTPHFSLAEFIAINNERVIPQQGISSVTNVHDIESYIAGCQKITGRNYLRAFDIPMKERDKVMNELSMMGITAGSLFPGLDGACEEIKERLFTTL